MATLSVKRGSYLPEEPLPVILTLRFYILSRNQRSILFLRNCIYPSPQILAAVKRGQGSGSYIKYSHNSGAQTTSEVFAAVTVEYICAGANATRTLHALCQRLFRTISLVSSMNVVSDIKEV